MNYMRFFYLLGIILAVSCVAVSNAQGFPYSDNLYELRGLELITAVDYLDEILLKLAERDNNSRYKVAKITSVTSESISDVVYYYTVELIAENNTKHCTIEMRVQLSVPETPNKIRINCEDDTEIEANF